MPMEGEAVQQSSAATGTLKNELEIRLLLNPVTVSLAVYVFSLSYKEMEAI